jgi:hypothetical protein
MLVLSRSHFFFFFFWNPNLYHARVQQRYRSGHILLRSAIMSVHFWKEPASAGHGQYVIVGVGGRGVLINCGKLFVSVRFPALPRFNAGPSLLYETKYFFDALRIGEELV